MRAPTIESGLADMGGMLLTGSGAEWGKLIADETEKWGKVTAAPSRRSSGVTALSIADFAGSRMDDLAEQPHRN